jgi:ectoine hydroxylase-related dioxygenase (phytanoyl-CoA dioxygenase family)
MKNNKITKKYQKDYEKNGFVLIRNIIDKSKCTKALKWLKSKNRKKLARSWTELEPGVDLAVYFIPHKEKSPISELVNNKKVLNIASKLAEDEVYIYSSKVNLKAPWCGAVEYFHQDLVYWRDRGYPREDMLSAMVFLEPHNDLNAPLNIFPKTHKLGFIKHEPFININGLAKFMVPPKTLDKLKKKYGVLRINANPGDVLFFHMGCVHGSGHNISSESRAVALSQLNTLGNIPKNVEKNSKKFNLKRAKREFNESERRLAWFKSKYLKQLKSKKLTFSAPIVKQEK